MFVFGGPGCIEKTEKIMRDAECHVTWEKKINDRFTLFSWHCGTVRAVCIDDSKNGGAIADVNVKDTWLGKPIYNLNDAKKMASHIVDLIKKGEIVVYGQDDLRWKKDGSRV